MHVAVVTTAPLDTTQLTGELTRALCGAGINGITITVTATVAAYNDWDVDRTMSLCADDCRFVGPATGEIDSAAFEANMRQMLAAYPDRRLRILASAVGDGCEFAEVELTGGPMNVSGAVVFAVVDDAVTSQRWYYAPPPGGFTTPSR
jgi:hypothetical protein